MNSSKLISEYPLMSKGTLEWEIRNLGLHLQKCENCYASENCWIQKNSLKGHSETLTSASTKLAAGDGNQSEWRFSLNLYERNLNIDLLFDGLFQSDGSRINMPLTFCFDAVIEKCIMGRTEIMCSPSGRGSSTNTSSLIKAIPFQEFTSILPNGNLKITVEISHLSDLDNQVVNNGQFLDLLDFTDSVPGCYGNLVNNPDLADFTIICEGSTFHAHKLILSVRSPVFRAMLESEMLESTENKLEINGMAVETLKLMLEYIYKGTIEIFPEDLKDKIGLLDSAEKYELKGLKSICMRKLFSNPPSEKDVGELAMAASVYGANDGAQKAITDFCMKNLVKLMENPEFKKMFLANPQIFVN